MSMMRCEKHGAWDSDFLEECPRCSVGNENAAAQAVLLDGQTSALPKQISPASAAAPIDYPGIPEDLRRQIRGERWELVEALREAKPYVVIRMNALLRHDFNADNATVLVDRIDALLAKEES